MKKAELVQDLASRLNVTKAVATGFVDALAEVAEQQLKQEGEFTVPGIARLTTKDVPAKPARPGRNPATGEVITIAAKPATKKVNAKPVKALSTAIAG